MVEIKFSWTELDGTVTTETHKVPESVADYLESLHEIINSQSYTIQKLLIGNAMQSTLIDAYRVLTNHPSEEK